MKSTSFDLKLTQIAWVTKDIAATANFFKETMGLNVSFKIETSRARDYEATYYGKPSNAENLVAFGSSGGIYLELIQPVSGNSVFMDYLEKNPAGGIQHIAYSTSIDNLDAIISVFQAKGFPVISFFNTSIAKIVFFDTTKEIGMMTEIIGLTDNGIKVFANGKNE